MSSPLMCADYIRGALDYEEFIRLTQEHRMLFDFTTDRTDDRANNNVEMKDAQQEEPPPPKQDTTITTNDATPTTGAGGDSEMKNKDEG